MPMVTDQQIQSLFKQSEESSMSEEFEENYPVPYEEGEIESSGSSSQIPMTLSQEHLEFLDGTDEVPDALRKPLWGLFTRMNQLTYIKNDFELNRIRTQVRAVTRVMMWEGVIDIKQMVMIQRYVELQIQKSQGQSERKLLTPWLQQITRRDEVGDSRQSGGTVSKSLGFLFNR